MIRLCSVNDFSIGKAKGFAIADSQILVIQVQTGQFNAYLNRCPHLGVPLNWEPDHFMDSDGTFLRCATHGALFEPQSGLCVLGPCRGQSLWPLDFQIVGDDFMLDTSELPESPAPSN